MASAPPNSHPRKPHLLRIAPVFAAVLAPLGLTATGAAVLSANIEQIASANATKKEERPETDASVSADLDVPLVSPYITGPLAVLSAAGAVGMPYFPGKLPLRRFSIVLHAANTLIFGALTALSVCFREHDQRSAAA